MLNFQLPVYEVRAYFNIAMEGEFKVIHTFRNKWVLDCPSIEGNYFTRRTILSSVDNLPYRLYPLRKRISSMSQLVNSKAQKLIDAEGRLFNWVKTKYYNIEVKKVLTSTRTASGKHQCFIQGFGTPLVLDTHCQYVSIINVEGSPVLFDVHETKPEKPRTRVKL